MKRFPALLVPVALAALLLGACAVNTKDIAGRINGQPIEYAAWMDSYRAHYNNFQILNNRVPDSEEKELIKNQTWQDAAKGVILKSRFEKCGITVSAQETVDTLKNNVPAYILSSPLFQSQQGFDRQKYLQSLEYDTPENLAPLRQQYRDFTIPILKLRQILPAAELLNAQERKLTARILRSRADIQWIAIDPAALDPIISDEEVQVRYTKDIDLYKIDPYYSLDWVTWPVKPSQDDIADAQALADSLYADLTRGTDPQEALTKHRAAATGLLWKNSGWLRNLDLDPAIYALLAQMEDGAIAAPVADSEGFTIYQLEQRTKSMSIFNTLRVPFLPSQKSIDRERPAAQRISSLATTLGLSGAASELDLTLRSTGKIPAAYDWLDDPTVIKEIKLQLGGKLKPGQTFGPVYSPRLSSWFVFEVQENALDSVKSLAEVAEEVRAQLAKEKRLAMSQNLAEQILAGQIPQSGTVQTLHVADMTTDSSLGGQPAGDLFYHVMRAHYRQEKPASFEHAGLLWIPRVNSVTDDKSRQPSSAEIEALFTRNLAPDWFDTWMASQISSARVVIYQQ